MYVVNSFDSFKSACSLLCFDLRIYVKNGEIKKAPVEEMFKRIVRYSQKSFPPGSLFEKRKIEQCLAPVLNVIFEGAIAEECTSRLPSIVAQNIKHKT
jgi:hypothetical protein